MTGIYLVPGVVPGGNWHWRSLGSGQVLVSYSLFNRVSFMPIHWFGGGGTHEDNLLNNTGHMDRLQSYYKDDRVRTMIKPTDFRFFLDSGAFSAWSKGAVIDLDEYCEFIRANIEWLDVYACLDVIPGAPGRAATGKEREEAAGQSWANYLYMKDAGLDPLPVYHYGEDMKWLDQMLAYGCEYVGIGGLVGIPSELRRLWLDRVFTKITDAAGHALIKTHGFGMTSLPLIFRYPWYSVDSTSWIKASMTGIVYLPQVLGGKFSFDSTPMNCSVSDRSPTAKEGGKHANTFSPRMREVLDQGLAECGKTYEQVSSNYQHRATCNAYFFKRVSEEKAGRAFVHRAVSKKAIW